MTRTLGRPEPNPIRTSAARPRDACSAPCSRSPASRSPSCSPSALDFVWIDLEHGALAGRRRAAARDRAARGGVRGLVRLRASDAPRSGRRSTPASTASSPRASSPPPRRSALVERLRHPPRGRAGSRPAARRRTARPGRARRPSAWSRSSRRAGSRRPRQIAAVDGVDALVVGCADLSLALDGTLGRLAALREAIARVQRAAAAAGIASGSPARTTPGCCRAGGRPVDAAGLLGPRPPLRARGGRARRRLRARARERATVAAVSAPEAWHVDAHAAGDGAARVRAAVGARAGRRARRARAHRAPGAQAARVARATWRSATAGGGATARRCGSSRSPARSSSAPS